MQAWLLINSFLYTEKFKEIYSLLKNAAKNNGIELKEMMHADVQKAKTLPHFAFTWDKDFYTAKSLEQKGVKLFNSADAFFTCDNKALTTLALIKNGIDIPKTVFSPKAYEATGYSDFCFLDVAIETLGLPIVIKEVYGSFGQQVYLAKTRDEAVSIIKSLGTKDFIMQEFIKISSGTDIRINVVGNTVISAMKRQNKEDFRSNITNGGSAFLYEPTEEEKTTAIKAAKACGCDFAGVDLLLGGKVCEVNSAPHFKSSQDTNGIDVADAIMKHILKKL